MPDFHVYVIRLGQACPLASCDDDCLGFTLRTLYDEGQLTSLSVVGILFRPDGQERGEWLVNPYGKERR